MLGTKFEKPLQADIITRYEGMTRIDEDNPASNTFKKYAEAAAWCDANNAMLEDKGDYYEVVAIPAPTTEELTAQVRAQRDALIAATDYLMASDYPLSDEKRAELITYRQALRDVPGQGGFPTTIVWPEKPDWLK